MTSNSKTRGYTDEDLKKAINCVKNESVRIREASRMYNIPRTTLQDKLSGRLPETVCKLGPPTVLTTAEETKITDWCIALTKCGFPIKRDELLNAVQKIILDDGRSTPFVNGRPSRKWFDLFMKRHPELVHRVPENLTKGRAVVTQGMIRNWFNNLESYLKEMNAEHIMKDPSRILNGDETGFSLCPKTGKVLAPKGYRNVYQVVTSSEKDTITVLLVFTASGLVVTPLVVFPYLRPPKEVVASMPPSWYLGRSESGWMKSDVFYEYVANGLYKWLEDNGIQKPVIFFVDGHKSHMTLELSEFCYNNGIILYALPPNTTHLMQPADVAVFKPLKSEWKKVMSNWQRSTGINNVTRSTFCPLLESVLRMNTLPDSIKNGFRKCGLYPYDPNAVDYSKCVRNTLDDLRIAEERIQPELPIAHDRYEDAIKVIQSMESNLHARGVSPDIINIFIDEIKKAKENSTHTRTQTQAPSLNSSLVDVFAGLNPGIYDLDLDGSVVREILFSEDNFIKNTDAPNSTETSEPNDPLSYSGVTCHPSTSTPNRQKSTTFSRTHATDDNLVQLPISINEDSNTCSSSPSSSTQLYGSRTNSATCSPSFDKHLKLPKTDHIFSVRKTNRKDKAPSAISSLNWRVLHIKKENEKKKIAEDIQKRKQDRLNRKEQAKEQKVKKRRKKEIQKCSNCAEDLISDAENDEEKNIGCDGCVRWFHLKCTEFKSYEEATKSEFYCTICKKQ